MSELITKDRIIILGENIDESSSKNIIDYIYKANASDDEEESKIVDFKRKPIKFIVNSNGGSTLDTLAIIDAIRLSKTPIYMHCAGYALSGGMMLFVAGSHRTCGKHSVFMYHDVSMTFNFSPLASIQEEVDHGRVVMNMINDLIVENTRIPREKLDEVRDKRSNWWITAQEALKLGIVEEVL